MPEHFQRTTGHARELTEAVKGPTLDLTTLTDQEEKIIQAVIQKDEVERSILEAKISEVRREIQEIRKAGALTAGDDQNAICARCKFKFLPFIVPWADHGQRCGTCKFRVCAKCRTPQPGGSWLCVLCFKYRQEKQLTGEFMSKGQPIASTLYGSDLLRASLRDRSRRRAGYVEAEGVNYIQRPAKTRQVDSDAETAAAASFSSVHQPEELRKEQSMRNRQGAGWPTNKGAHFRQVVQAAHIHRAAYGYSLPGNPEIVSASPQPQSAGFAAAAGSARRDVATAESLHAAEDRPDPPDGSVDGASFEESGTRKYCSFGGQLGHRNSTSITHEQIRSQLGHRNSTSITHEQIRSQRAFLNRIISISEQTLYYDDVKVAAHNMPRFSSLDSRSTTSLCSDYSINPKYRSLKQSSGTSELELFRKRGERYSLRRKRTLEDSQSEEKNERKPDTSPVNTSIDSGVNQKSSDMRVATSNTAASSKSQTSPAKGEQTVSANTSTDSGEIRTSSAKGEQSISANTSTDSSETRPSSEVKKTIPHWHEILRMQSVVEALTKQNKSPTAASSEPFNEAPEAEDQIFSLVKPKLRRTSAGKNYGRLTPSNSKDDSSSSQESISVYVASYMSPTTNKGPDQFFASTPKTDSSSELKNNSLQIFPGPAEDITDALKEIRHTHLNLSSNGHSSPDLPQTHKQKRNLFFVRQSRNGPRHQDWRGKRRLPTLDRVASLKRENSQRAKWPTARRQDSYSQAVNSEDTPASPPEGNTNRKGQWCTEVSSQSLHANTDPLESRQNLDSDTSSVASSVSSSQHASRNNSVGSWDGSRSLQDTNSIREKNIQTIVVRGNVPAVLPSKFRFRRSSSSLTESQRSDSLDSSSSYEKSKDGGESNSSRSPAVSQTSADEAHNGGGDGAVKAPPTEDNSFDRNAAIRTRSVSQDSFEDVYNSNASLFVQMMNSQESAEDGESTQGKPGKPKRLLPRRPGEEPPKAALAGGQRRTEKPNVTLASSNNHLSVPTVAVTNLGVEQSCKEDEDEEDDFDELFKHQQPNALLGSRSSLADSRESIYSVYSDAGEVNYGRISVTGEIMFQLNYNHKSSTLEVHIIQCKDLAPVDAKHNRSDPYVKTYLLPDKSRGSKRKTRIKKHTLSPIFDEILKYQISKTELETRSLWLTVWHNDRFGRNDFLGEVTIPLDYYSYSDNAPRWYPLQERTAAEDPMMSYRGDLFISLKYVSPDQKLLETGPKKKSGSLRKKAKEKEKTVPGLGEIQVLVKEAQNLTAMRGSAGSDPFCKGYLLPDESHGSKQKTPVVRKTTNPQWQHILVFEGVDQSRLPQHGLELTIWDFERMSSNDFLGGVRLNLGQDCHQSKPLDWMDARGEEIEAWQSMIDHPNQWVDAQLPLRVSMGKPSGKK